MPNYASLPCMHAYVLNHSVVSDSLHSCRLQPASLICPWDFPGKNTGVGCYALLKRIFLTQRLNLSLVAPELQAGSLPLSHRENPPLPWVAPVNTLTSNVCECLFPPRLGYGFCALVLIGETWNLSEVLICVGIFHTLQILVFLFLHCITYVPGFTHLFSWQITLLPGQGEGGVRGN